MEVLIIRFLGFFLNATSPLQEEAAGVDAFGHSHKKWQTESQTVSTENQTVSTTEFCIKLSSWSAPSKTGVLRKVSPRPAKPGRSRATQAARKSWQEGDRDCSALKFQLIDHSAWNFILWKAQDSARTDIPEIIHHPTEVKNETTHENCIRLK